MRFPGTQKNSCRNKHDEIIVESYLKTITKKKNLPTREISITLVKEAQA